MKFSSLCLLLTLAAFYPQKALRAESGTGDAASDNVGWPRSYTVENAEVVLDEPRVEKWQGSVIHARFAASIKLAGESRAHLGSFNASAETQTNTDARTVTIYNITAQDVRFPDAAENNAEFVRLINALAPEKPIKVSLDTLLAAVPPDDIVTQKTILTETRNKVPRIIVSSTPAVLLAFDGAPVFRPVPGSGLEAAVNTPATVLRPEGRKSPLYLLTNDGLWLAAQSDQGPWRQAAAPPEGLERIPSDHPVAQALKSVTPPPGAVINVPDVVTSDEPAEIIQIDGKPNYKRIGNLPLARVGNTDSPLFYDFDSSTFYVLISGRWFSAPELKGPWVYVPHNSLPDEFAQIPTDDPSAYVRVSIAGTREADEAVKEAQIPVVARVNLREAPAIEVDYDGDPAFEEIPGTEMSYAINTPYEVIRIGGFYYCCHDGLWFVAERALGGRWRCATALPRAIFTIPPSCPLYHTRFCDIERYADDEVVYRYSAGYYGTYIDPVTRVCIYGTGYRYQPYVSDQYYCGRSWTYGLGSTYRPRHGFVYENRHVASTGWYSEDHRKSRHESDGWRVSAGSRSLHATGGKWLATTSEATPYTRWTRGVSTHHEPAEKKPDHKVSDKDKPHVVFHGRADERHADVFRKNTPAVKETHVTRENRKVSPPEKTTIDPRKITPVDPGRRGGERPVPGKVPEQHKLKKEVETPPSKPVHHDEPKPQIPSRQDPRPEKSVSPKDSKHDRVVEPDRNRGQKTDHVEERKIIRHDNPKPVERREAQPHPKVVEEPRHVSHDPPKEIKREQPREQPRAERHAPQPVHEDKGSVTRSESKPASHDSKKDDKSDKSRGR